jgi:hypothetical protein
MGKLYRVVFLLLLLLPTGLPARAQKFDIDTLQYHGQSKDYINLVILGDGYTADQLDKYSGDARRFTNYLFSQVPFQGYKTYFNVFAIRVPSQESGVKHPRTTTDPECKGEPIADPENYFGTTFDAYGIHRLVVPTNNNNLTQVLADNLPDYDQVVILANTPYYGGSGGSFATATLEARSNDIALHELGHSFADLADEYWVGGGYAAEKPNMTLESSPDRIKWKSWLGANKGIGIHPHEVNTWFKPTHFGCKMQVLDKALCAVCAEAIIGRIHNLAKPKATYKPDTSSTILTSTNSPSFYVSLRKISPSPATLRKNWRLNGNALAGNKDSVRIQPNTLALGTNNLSVLLSDTTSQLRNSALVPADLLTLNWTITHSAAQPVTLTGFQATARKDGVLLTWTTAMEVMNDHFAIQKSSNAQDWEVIGTVKGQGTSIVGQAYFFLDPAIPSAQQPIVYYRLKQVDWDGSFSYSALQAVQIKPLALQVKLVENPVSDQLHFEFSRLPALPLTLGIYNLVGGRIFEFPLAIRGQDPSLRLGIPRLAPGVYIYSFSYQAEVLDSGRFLKVR